MFQTFQKQIQTTKLDLISKLDFICRGLDRGYLSFNVPLSHLHHPRLLFGTLGELSQRHLITHHLTLAAVSSAGSPGAANPVDTAHLSPTYRVDV